MASISEQLKIKETFYTRLIWVLAIAIPLVVGILLNPRLEVKLDLGFNPYILPRLNAFINSAVSILLVLGFVFIRRKEIARHRFCMLGAFSLSAVFLVSYVLYHLMVGHTPYCEEGSMATLYYVLLVSHILLSAVIVPLASFSIFRALSERIDKHRRIARITFPIWLYVAVTGVLIYGMISPCYPGA